jgi:type II secretory pathway predicted ATPase ExeA
VNRKLLALYGLKWNPFSPEIPTEAILVTSKIESFCFRIENGVAQTGGIAMLEGDPGMGKSVTTRVLASRLSKLPDVKVRSLARPRCGVGDFYRELGDLFDLPQLRPHNRWHSFKSLRETWEKHIANALFRPFLIVDQAEEMWADVVKELRTLSSTEFDSRCLLGIVFAGDKRLGALLGSPELAPIANRIRTRLVLEPATSEELLACLKHATTVAGNPKLMTAEVAQALAEHALGNYRQLMIFADELLTAAAERDAPQIDEKIFFDVVKPPTGERARATSRRRP